MTNVAAHEGACERAIRDYFGGILDGSVVACAKMRKTAAIVMRQMDALRAQWPNPYPCANDKLAAQRAKALERIRELRRQIAVLGKEYWDISLEVNAAWHAQKPLWMKRFA